MGCIFCAIVSGDAPADILDQTPHCLIIRPLYPVTDGHALVIPRRHIENALRDTDLTGIVFRDAAAYVNRWQVADEVNFITSVGTSATQSVFHLHVHVVPRRPGDGLLLPWSHPDTVRKYLEHTVVQDRPDWHRESRSGA